MYENLVSVLVADDIAVSTGLADIAAGANYRAIIFQRFSGNHRICLPKLGLRTARRLAALPEVVQ